MPHIAEKNAEAIQWRRIPFQEVHLTQNKSNASLAGHDETGGTLVGPCLVDGLQSSQLHNQGAADEQPSKCVMIRWGWMVGYGGQAGLQECAAARQYIIELSPQHCLPCAVDST